MVVIFVGFGQAGAKRCEGCFKVRGGDESHKRWAHCVIQLYCETLLEVLLGIYCKKIYWIPLFTILLLFYVFEVGKAKSATQKCPNDINTE